MAVVIEKNIDRQESLNKDLQLEYTKLI